MIITKIILKNILKTASLEAVFLFKIKFISKDIKTGSHNLFEQYFLKDYFIPSKHT